MAVRRAVMMTNVTVDGAFEMVIRVDFLFQMCLRWLVYQQQKGQVEACLRGYWAISAGNIWRNNRVHRIGAFPPLVRQPLGRISRRPPRILHLVEVGERLIDELGGISSIGKGSKSSSGWLTLESFNEKWKKNSFFPTFLHYRAQKPEKNKHFRTQKVWQTYNNILPSLESLSESLDSSVSSPERLL